MPKKKPVAKRLKKLFQDIEPEATTSDSTRTVGKFNAEISSTLPSTVKIEPLSQRARPVELVRHVASQSSIGLTMDVQTGRNNWSTLQVVDETDQKRWSLDDELLVRQVADQLSLALENAQLFKETQSRAQELTVLNEVGQALAATILVEQITAITHRGISRLFDVKNFYIALYDEQTNEVVFPHNDSESVRDESITRLPFGKGLTSYMIRSRESILISDGTEGWIQEHGETPVGEPAKSFLGVPLILGDKVLGALALQDYHTPNRYDEHDLRLLTSFANQTAIALENARLFQESQQRAEETARLNRLVNRISESLDVQKNLQIIADEIADITSALHVGIALINKEKDALILSADAPSTKGGDDLGIRIPIAGNPTAESVITHKQPLFINDTYNNPITKQIVDILKRRNTQSLFIWPIISGRDVIGTVGVDFDDPHYRLPERQQNLINTILFQISTLIQNGNLFRAVTDSRTQLSEALQIARIGYFEIDLPTRTITFTDELFSLLNTTFEKEDRYEFPLDTALQNFVLPEDIPAAEKAVQDAIGANRELIGSTSEVRYRTRDGRVIWVSSTYKVENDSSGRALKVAGSSQDITERKTNELIQGAITRISDSAIIATNIHELFKSVHDTIGTLVPSKNFYLALYDAQADIMTFPYYVDEFDLPMPPQKLGRGLTSYVIRTKKPLRATPEIYAELAKSGEVSGAGTNSLDWLGVPLRSETTIRGVIAIQSYDPSVRITEQHKEILTVLGTQTTAAIERLQAREALQRRNTYLAASSEIGRLVTSTLDLNTIFTRTVNLVSERFGFYFVGIYNIEETGFNVILRGGTGDAGKNLIDSKHSVAVGSQTIVGKVAETGESKLANDIQSEPLFQPNLHLPETRSQVVIPLRIGQRIVGVIDIQSRENQAFTRDDISVLQSLGDQVAVAIDNARSYELSQQLIKDLREVDQLKSQFLANMSHELRTPLNSIIGFSRVILKGIDGPITDMQQQDLTAIYNSGQHLLGLINDILDLARIEAGKMELIFEEVSLTDMVNSVLSTAKGLVKEKPIQLLSRIPADLPTVRGDTMRIRQVFINLLSNASKFTDDGSITVEAGIQKSPTGKMEALINVIDTGPGISFEDQEKLFKAFSQVDGSATRKSGGSGLGLSICANLVQLQGGRINVHSEVGHGATFWFTLPLYNQPIGDIPLGKIVVLAIDDDPQVIGLYERYLNPQGYHVVGLNDPSRAKELILKINPHVITLDIMMPNIDGWTLLAKLKSDPETREYPVIVCSILEQTEKGFNLGAADYLIKPILEEDLVHALNRLNRNGAIHEILVIDHNPDDLQLMEKILKENGQYNPILAEGGRRGWELMNANPPQAVILNVFMPDMDGFMILEKMSENPALRDIPVLVVSAGGITTKQQLQLKEFGQRVITKGSFKKEELISGIEQILRRQGNQGQVSA